MRNFGEFQRSLRLKIGDDELTEGFDVFVDAVEVFVRGFANGVAVTGAHGVDEDEVGLVEKAFIVVDEFVRARAE